MDPAAQQPAAGEPLFPTPNLHAFHAVLLVLDVLYIAFARIQHKAFRRGNAGGWPAAHHQATRASQLCVAAHVIAGTGVLVLGGSLFIASHWTRSFSPAAFTCMAALGVAQSLTVLPLLGKVQGTRALTVPWYVGLACLVLCSSLRLLTEPSFHQAMLLWGTVNTFIWVRLFWAVFGLVSAAARTVVYTAAVAISGVFGITLAGQDPRWLWLYAAPVAYAPLMAGLTQLSQSRWPLVAWAARVCAAALSPDPWHVRRAMARGAGGAAAQDETVAEAVGAYAALRASIQASMRMSGPRRLHALGGHSLRHHIASR